MQMKKNFSERVRDSLILLGRKNKIVKIPAVIALFFWLLLCSVCRYLQKGTKRFACVVFILGCFFLGNSFSFPVLFGGTGFLSEPEIVTLAAMESDLSLVSVDVPETLEVEYLEDFEADEGYENSDLLDEENQEYFTLEELLHENEGYIETVSNTPTDMDILYDDVLFTEDDWRLILINKQHPIPSDYDFSLGNIKTYKGIMQCDERIVDDLLGMMQGAAEDGIDLAIMSPFRDMNRQEVLFDRKIESYMRKGLSYMDAYIASCQTVTVPGASEHQIGLAFDIVCNDYITLDAGFGDTDAGKWLYEHCSEYGFILRYPLGKEYITGIEYEPWHFRYVGHEAATIIMDNQMCLEEFWDKYL